MGRSITSFPYCRFNQYPYDLASHGATKVYYLCYLTISIRLTLNEWFKFQCEYQTLLLSYLFEGVGVKSINII